MKINSFQSLGAVDGPGVRVVVFMQGCNIRCKYCHNPETWATDDGKDYSYNEVYNNIIKYKNYIYDRGGVTFSGGEPLLQAKELLPLFIKLKEDGYHIALDTNGSIINDSVIELLEYTDLVLLDIKMTDGNLYSEFTGLDIGKVYDFFDLLIKMNKKIWIRQVVIEGVNDNEENIERLRELYKYKNVEKIELLPFKKICIEKYNGMNMEFPMADYKETDMNIIKKLQCKLIHNIDN